jgi:hypothetical protein
MGIYTAKSPAFAAPGSVTSCGKLCWGATLFGGSASFIGSYETANARPAGTKKVKTETVSTYITALDDALVKIVEWQCG